MITDIFKSQNYKVILLLSTAIGWVSPALAAVYQGTDANGVAVFTDKPEKHADKSLSYHSMQGGNNIQYPQTQPNALNSNQANIKKTDTKTIARMPNKQERVDGYQKTPIKKQSQVPETTAYNLSITEPKQEVTIVKPNDLVVNASILPALHPKHSVAVVVDGKQVGSSTTTSVSTKTMDRGMHTLSVVIYDGDNNIISKASQSFFLYQHSILFKKNQKKPTEESKKVDIDGLKI